MTRRTPGRADAGFTLIELMVALAILAVVVAVALPSYRSHVLRSHRSDGLATLTTYQAILERCYAQNFAYAKNCAGLPAAWPQPSPQGFYTIDLSVSDGTTYVLSAQAAGTQQDDTACLNVTLNQANARAPLACWNP